MRYGNNRGAVSIFLIMILVPCLAVTSIFVETGRVNLSKASADASADLALNSLLTNYDGDLMEWYGLMASCQNIDQCYEATQKTFERALKSANLSDEEIILVSSKIQNMLNAESVSDLLKIESEAGSVTVGAVDGTSLENPAMMRDKIVEFMKYRGPIELASGLIDRLSGLTDEISQMKQSGENEEVVNKKEDYYESESELMKQLLRKYRTLMTYHQALSASLSANKIGVDASLLEKYSNEMASYISTYEQIIEITIKYLLNTSGLTQYSRVTTSLDGNTYTYKSSGIYSKKKTDDEDVVHYYISQKRIDEFLTDLESKITELQKSMNEYADAAKPYMDKMYGSADSSYNEIQWWKDMNGAVNSGGGNKTSDVKNKVSNLVTSYFKVLAMKGCEFDDTVTITSWDDKENETVKKYDTLTSNARNLITKNFLSSSSTSTTDSGNSGYLKAANALVKVSADNSNKINVSNHTVTLNGETLSIENALKKISSNLTERYNEISEYYNTINVAIDGNFAFPLEKSLEEIKAKIEEVEGNLGIWEGAANQAIENTKEGENALAKADKVQIEEIRTNTDETGGISIDDVDELKDRLVNIRSVLKGYLDLVNNFKFGSEKIMAIGDFSTFKGQISINENDVAKTNGEIKNQIKNEKDTRISPKASDLKVANASDTAYHLLIDPISGFVNTPKMFTKMHKKFYEDNNKSEKSIEEKTKEKEDDQGKASEEEGKQKEEATSGKYHYGGDAENQKALGTPTNLLSNIGGIADFFTKLLNKPSDILNDLYSAEYVMMMFTYATIEDEGCFKLMMDDKEKSKVALKLSTSDVRSLTYCQNNEEDVYNLWKSEDLKDTKNKTLTNKMFSLENNRSFGAEVEYILKGKADNNENVKAVYTDIYAIRYILNLVSGTINFWSATNGNATAAAINGVADAISLATCGIIPAPLTKILMIALLTAFETAVDNNRLAAGFPVEIYKKDTSYWVCSLPNLDDVDSIMDMFGEIGKDKKVSSDGSRYANKGKGLYYSDYLTAFVYLGFSSSGTSGSMYKRIAQLISSNIGHLRGESDGENPYSLSKSMVYFNLNATVVVDPLMFNLNIYNGYNEGVIDKKNWRTYTINITRGYS